MKNFQHYLEMVNNQELKTKIETFWNQKNGLSSVLEIQSEDEPSVKTVGDKIKSFMSTLPENMDAKEVVGGILSKVAKEFEKSQQYNERIPLQTLRVIEKAQKWNRAEGDTIHKFYKDYNLFSAESLDNGVL